MASIVPAVFIDEYSAGNYPTWFNELPLLHIDVTDGIYAGHNSIKELQHIHFNISVELHLMMQAPSAFLQKVEGVVLRIFVHPCALTTEERALVKKWCSIHDVQLGYAYTVSEYMSTTAEDFQNAQREAISFLYMTIQKVGAMGQSFYPPAYSLISSIARGTSWVADGGISSATVPLLLPYTPEHMVVGSAVRTADGKSDYAYMQKQCVDFERTKHIA
jgi:pentose-5-phosphate-3-epimerase